MHFDDNDLITLAEAGQLVPGTRHSATIWRWANNGLYGVLLETLEIGGVAYTSRRALQEFCEAVTAVKKERALQRSS